MRLLLVRCSLLFLITLLGPGEAPAESRKAKQTRIKRLRAKRLRNGFTARKAKLSRRAARRPAKPAAKTAATAATPERQGATAPAPSATPVAPEERGANLTPGQRRKWLRSLPGTVLVLAAAEFETRLEDGFARLEPETEYLDDEQRNDEFYHRRTGTWRGLLVRSDLPGLRDRLLRQANGVGAWIEALDGGELPERVSAFLSRNYVQRADGRTFLVELRDRLLQSAQVLGQQQERSRTLLVVGETVSRLEADTARELIRSLPADGVSHAELELLYARALFDQILARSSRYTGDQLVGLLWKLRPQDALFRGHYTTAREWRTSGRVSEVIQPAMLDAFAAAAARRDVRVVSGSRAARLLDTYITFPDSIGPADERVFRGGEELYQRLKYLPRSTLLALGRNAATDSEAALLLQDPRARRGVFVIPDRLDPYQILDFVGALQHFVERRR